MRERSTGLARALRRRETNSEEKLWRALRGRQLDGWKFRRQAPHGSYVVDFMCFEAQLVVEIDGAQHQEPEHQAKDEARDRDLKAEGFRVLRVSNSDVIDNLGGVLEEIYRALGERAAPSPGALRRQRSGGLARRPFPDGKRASVCCKDN